MYFYDVPDAKQSVIRFGYPALAQTDKDFYPATVMNYILGGGGFASRLTQELREGKGYTYGINSGFAGTQSPGAVYDRQRRQEQRDSRIGTVDQEHPSGLSENLFGNGSGHHQGLSDQEQCESF